MTARKGHFSAIIRLIGVGKVAIFLSIYNIFLGVVMQKSCLKPAFNKELLEILKYQLMKCKGNEQQDEAIVQDEPLYEVKQKQMENLIHKSICAILWKRGRNTQRFSGVLISPNLVLTCAHGLYNKEETSNNKQRVKDSQMEVYPAQHGVMKMAFQVEKSFVPEEYQNNPSVQFDYALLKLAQKVHKPHFIPLEPYFNQEQNAQIGIFGYPADQYKLVDKKQAIYQVKQWGLIRNVDRVKDVNVNAKLGKLCYEISTKRGQSGSPVILISGQKLSIIGIHKSANTNQKNNIGRLITLQLLQKLQFQAIKLQAEMFKDTFTSSQQQYLAYLLSLLQTLRDISEQAQRIQSYLQIKRKFKQNLEKALQHAKRKQFSVALMYGFQALQLDPQYSSTYYLVGKLYFVIDNWSQARIYLERAVQLKIQSQEIYEMLGRISCQERLFEQAIKWLQKAIQKNPQMYTAYNYLGLSYKNLKQYQQAILMYSLAQNQNLENDYDFMIGFGQAYQGKKETEAAIKCFRKAIEINPQSGSAHVYLGKLYLNTSRQYKKNEQMAKDYFIKSVEMQHNRQSILQLGSYLSDSQQYEIAKRCYQAELVKFPKDKQILYQLGRIYINTGQTDEGIKAFTKILEIDDKFGKAYYSLGECWQMQKKYPEAIAYFTQYLDFDPHKHQVTIKIAELQKKKL